MLQRFFQSLISHCVRVKVISSSHLSMCLIWKTAIRQISTNSAHCSFTVDVLDSLQLFSLLSQFDFRDLFFRSFTKAKWALTTLLRDPFSFSSVHVISSIISPISQRKCLLWFPPHMGQTLLYCASSQWMEQKNMWVTQAHSGFVIEQENWKQECCEQTPDSLMPVSETHSLLLRAY